MKWRGYYRIIIYNRLANNVFRTSKYTEMKILYHCCSLCCWFKWINIVYLHWINGCVARGDAKTTASYCTCLIGTLLCNSRGQVVHILELLSPTIILVLCFVCILLYITKYCALGLFYASIGKLNVFIIRYRRKNSAGKDMQVIGNMYGYTVHILKLLAQNHETDERHSRVLWNRRRATLTLINGQRLKTVYYL